jgi:hypothetical protein
MAQEMCAAAAAAAAGRSNGLQLQGCHSSIFEQGWLSAWTIFETIINSSTCCSNITTCWFSHVSPTIKRPSKHSLIAGTIGNDAMQCNAMGIPLQNSGATTTEDYLLRQTFLSRQQQLLLVFIICRSRQPASQRVCQSIF